MKIIRIDYKAVKYKIYHLMHQLINNYKQIDINKIFKILIHFIIT